MNLFILSLCLIAIADALTIVSDIPSISYINNQLVQNRQITYRCTDADSGLTQTLTFTTSNGTKIVTVTCNAPQYIYTLTIIGYVPEDGRLSVREFCKVRDPFTQTNVTDAFDRLPFTLSADGKMHSSSYVQIPPHLERASAIAYANSKKSKLSSGPKLHERVKRSDIDIQRAGYVKSKKDLESLKAEIAEYQKKGAEKRKKLEAIKNEIVQLKETIQNHELLQETGEEDAVVHASWGLGNLISVIAGPALTGCFVPLLGCGGGNGGGDGVDQQTFDDFKKSANNRLEALKAFEESTQKWQTTTTSTILELRSDTEKLVSIASSNAAATAAVNNAVLAERDMNQMMFTATTKEIAGIQSLITSSQASLEAARVATQNLVSGGINDMSVSVSGLYNVTKGFNDALQLSVDSMNKNLRRFDEKLRAITVQLRNVVGAQGDAISRIQEQRALTAQIQEAIDTILTTTDFVPMLQDYGTPPASYLGQYKNMLVDTVRVMYKTSANVLVQEDYSYSCDTVTMLNRRSSWFTFRDLLASIGPSACTPGNPANTTDNDGTCICWMRVSRVECNQLDGTAATAFLASDGMNATSYCLNGNAGLITSATVTYDNATTLMNYMTATKCSEVSSGTIYVRSYRTNKQIAVAYTSDQCVNDLETIFDAGSLVLNWVFSFWRMLESSFDVTRMNFRYYEDFIDGVIPTGVTVEDFPFSRSGGQSASCVQASFMSYSTTMLPVYRLDYSSFTTSTTVLVNGVSTTYDNIIPSLAASQVLPNSYKIIGNPAGTTIYDFDQADMPSGPIEQSRRFSPLLALNDENKPLNYSKFVSLYGSKFYALGGMYVAKYGECAVSQVSGLCTCPYNPASGTWCTVLANNLVTNNGQGAIIISPNEWSFEADVIVPDGVITQILFSTCPTMTIDQVSGSVYQLVFTNIGSANTVITIKEEGPCPKTTSLFGISGGGASRKFNIQPCLAGNKTKTVTIFYYNGTTLTECPGLQKINVTIFRPDFVSIGRPDVQYVDVRTVTENDKSTIALAKIVMQLNKIITDLTLTDAIAYKTLGLDFTSSGMQSFNLAITSMMNMSNFLNTTFAATRQRESYNYTELINSYYGDLATSLAANAAINATLVQIQLLAAAQNASAAMFEQLKVELQNNNFNRRVYLAMEAIWVNETNKYFQNVNDAVAAIVNGDPCNFPFGVCDVARDLIDGAKTVAEDAINDAKDVSNTFGNIFSSFGNFFKSLLYLGLPILIIVAVVFLAFILLRYLAKRQQEKGSSGKFYDALHDREIIELETDVTSLEEEAEKLKAKLKEIQIELREGDYHNKSRRPKPHKNHEQVSKHREARKAAKQKKGESFFNKFRKSKSKSTSSAAERELAPLVQEGDLNTTGWTMD